MIAFDESFFLGETRDDFYIEEMMKRAWAAEMEVLQIIDQICQKHHLRWFAYLRLHDPRQKFTGSRLSFSQKSTQRRELITWLISQKTTLSQKSGTASISKP